MDRAEVGEFACRRREEVENRWLGRAKRDGSWERMKKWRRRLGSWHIGEGGKRRGVWERRLERSFVTEERQKQRTAEKRTSSHGTTVANAPFFKCLLPSHVSIDVVRCSHRHSAHVHGPSNHQLFAERLLAATGLGLSAPTAETHLPIVFLASVTGSRDAPPDRLPRLRRKKQRRTSGSSSSPPSQAAETHLPIVFLASVASSRDAPPDRLPRLRRRQQRRLKAEGCHFSLSSPRLQSTEKNPNLPLLFSLSSLSSSRGRNSPHLKVTGSRNTEEIRKQPPILAQGHCEMRG
ncbi:hypothetical protein ACLOJK_028126 [Asimina triloba]